MDWFRLIFEVGKMNYLFQVRWTCLEPHYGLTFRNIKVQLHLSRAPMNKNPFSMAKIFSFLSALAVPSLESLCDGGWMQHKFKLDPKVELNWGIYSRTCFGPLCWKHLNTAFNDRSGINTNVISVLIWVLLRLCLMLKPGFWELNNSEQMNSFFFFLDVSDPTN